MSRQIGIEGGFFGEQPELVRIPMKPLGALSDYVVTELPAVNGRQDVGELVASAASLVAGLSEDTATAIARPHADLALLDLKLLEISIVQQEGTPPDALIDLVDRFSVATGQLPGLTYEDLIFTNPLTKDPRVFTAGEIGQSELGFYNVHRAIEGRFAEAIPGMFDAITYLRGGDNVSAWRVLAGAAQELQQAYQHMYDIDTNMPKEHFQKFRTFFRPHPIRGTEGASGIFSAAFPTVDILLQGSTLDSSDEVFTDTHMKYFPRRGREDIARARGLQSEGLTLADFAVQPGQPEELRQSVRQVFKAVRRLRGRHMLATVHHDARPGTNMGLAAPELLTRRLHKPFLG